MLLVCFLYQMTPPQISGPKLPQRVSLAEVTAQSLRESMQSGHWQGYLPGERELCECLQVSRSTIRTALAALERDGILEVAERQRRRIKLPNAGKPAANSQVIALITARPLLAMTAASVVMVDELRDQLARAGFRLEIHVSTACFSSKPARALEGLTARSPAAAWLLMGSIQSMQDWFLRRQLPCLVVGSSLAGVALPSVDTDYRATCRHAGAMLRRAGHRHLIFLRPEGGYGGDLESEHGLKEALQGEDAPALQVLRHNGTAQHVCALLDKALRSARPPTACLVARATHVLTVMMFLMQRGLRIPQDMAVVARDDDAFLQHTTPTTARYASNPAQFARRVCVAARQLAETGSLPPKAIRLMPKFIKGESC